MSILLNIVNNQYRDKGGKKMQIEYRAFGKNKIAMIWLTNEDQNDETLEIVDNTIKELSEKKYKVAVFYSGKDDLCEQTKKLLVKNLSA